MALAVRTDGLTKRYGDVVGVRDLNLEVEAGEVFGYLGPNGAGKTTTIRLLLDLIRPTGGRAEVLGLDPATDSVAIRRRVGYLPGELSLYENMTGRDLLTYLGRLRGNVPPDKVSAIAERLEVDLDRPTRTLSKGNKQKIGIIQAFMHDPELLILDEPTSGLDPLMQRRVKELIREAAFRGSTVFLCSHVLSEVEEVADRVGIIRGGSVAEIGRLTDLRAKTVREVGVVFAEEIGEDAFEEFARLEGATVIHRNLKSAHIRMEGAIDPLIKMVARHEVADLTVKEADLEDIFFTYYDEDAS